jgi:uroporphyrin-3 C-methyltransferase
MADQNTGTDENKKRHLPWRNIGILFSALGTILFIFAFAFGYFELSKVNIALAQKVSDLEHRMVSSQSEITAVQKSTETLAVALKETDVIKKQQEEILSEWRSTQKGDLAKGEVARAAYLVKIANDHLKFTHQYPLAILLLKRADQLLANLSDPNLSEIKQSITKAITSIEALPVVDPTPLFLRLTAENVQLDHLPLPLREMKAPSKSEGLKTQEVKSQSTKDQTFWDALWDRLITSLNKIVIVRKNITNQPPLLLPEEKTFLYQNLHAQLENAKWAVLYRNQPIYQTSLARALTWVIQYFDQSAPETIAIKKNLSEMLEINIQPTDLNLDLTLQLFNNYLSNSQNVTTPTTP